MSALQVGIATLLFKLSTSCVGSWVGLGGSVAEGVVEVVEVEVWEYERNFHGFEDIMGGNVNTLDMTEEAYYLGYTLYNLVAKVESSYLYLAKAAKELGNSIVESKYYMVHTVVA
jgi:hypothetical protein